jgi:thiol:disulfide interchange protein DsbD
VALSRRFKPLRLDLTRRLPGQERFLERYGVRGVPTVIFLNTRGEEERHLRIETYLGRAEVLQRMQKALE